MRVLITGSEGHVGSRLFDHLSPKYSVDVVDLKLGVDYKDLTYEQIMDYQVIVHLAGHSSVKSCDDEPRESLFNNCINFFHFVEKVEPSQKFIYASSGSVYGSSGEIPAKEIDELPFPTKFYDEQKQLIDFYMGTSDKTYYGLRFGTVCGASRNPRNDLMINLMSKTAIEKKQVDVTSSGSYRAVLGINDLCRAVETIITASPPPGFYNLASFNSHIGEIGKRVSDRFNCSFYSKVAGNSNYSFQLDTSKFTSLTGFEFQDTVESIVDEVKGMYNG